MLKETLLRWFKRYGEAGAQQASYRGSFEPQVPDYLKKNKCYLEEHKQKPQ